MRFEAILEDCGRVMFNHGLIHAVLEIFISLGKRWHAALCLTEPCPYGDAVDIEALVIIGSPFQGLAGCQLWCDERRGTVGGLIEEFQAQSSGCQPNFVIVFFHRKWYGRITNPKQKIYISAVKATAQTPAKLEWVGRWWNFLLGLIAYSQVFFFPSNCCRDCEAKSGFIWCDETSPQNTPKSP